MPVYVISDKELPMEGNKIGYVKKMKEAQKVARDIEEKHGDPPYIYKLLKVKVQK